MEDDIQKLSSQPHISLINHDRIITEFLFIFSRHIFKNAIIPIAQGIPASLAACITGAIITESIYSVGGMGKMLPNAINQYNNIMIVALAFMFSLVSVLSVLAGDIVLTKVDPRISLSEKAGRS